MSLQARLTRLEEQANAVTVVTMKKAVPFDAAAYTALVKTIICPEWLPGAIEQMDRQLREMR